MKALKRIFYTYKKLQKIKKTKIYKSFAVAIQTYRIDMV